MQPIHLESTLLTSPTALLGLLAFLLLVAAAVWKPFATATWQMKLTGSQGQVYAVYSNPLSQLPGPTIARWTSLKLKWLLVRGHKMQYVHELHRRYGPIVRVAPTEVSLADKTAVRTIYKTGSPYLKSEWYKDFVGDKATFSLFSQTDRKIHGEHRRVVAANFTERWVKNLEPFIANNVRLTIARMADESKNKGYVDVFKWFTFMATDVIGDASFGESFKTLEMGKKSQYTSDLEKIGRYGVFRAEFPVLSKIMDYLPIKAIQHIQQSASRMAQYGERSVQRYWTQLKTDPDGVKPTLLTKEYAQVEAGIMPAVQLRRDATGYIIAGTDTTALTATYAVWLLSKNPDVEQALIREIASVPETFNDEDLHKLPVLNGVIYESLRLRTPISDGLPRIVPAGGVQFEGYFIPGGTTVGIPAWTMHRDPAIWQDPEAFRPSRWVEPTRDMKDCFLAFGGGSRVCLGMHFAQLELRHALTNFYRTFDNGMTASTAEGFGEQDMDPKCFFLMSPNGGRCLVTRRK